MRRPRRRRTTTRLRGRLGWAAVALASVMGSNWALAMPASAATTTIEDTAIGTGNNQVSYSGTWTQCSGCAPSALNSSYRYSTNFGAIATVRFTGSQVNIFGIKAPGGGHAAFSVDGDTPTVVDTFSTTVAATLVFSSGRLSGGPHVVKITNVHDRNPASNGYYVAFDRAEVATDPAPPPPPPPAQTATTVEDTAIGTGNNQVAYSTGWMACVGCVASPNNSLYYTGVPGAVVTIRFTGTQINVYGVKGWANGFGTFRIDGAQPAVTDTYAPDSTVTLLYTSNVLTAGAHTLTYTNDGHRNATSTGNNIGFDRAEITTTAPPTAPPSYAGPRSGKPWLSGTFPDPVMNQQNLEAFCNWRGAPCDFVLLYVTRNNWTNVTQPADLLRTFATWPGRLIISIPPFPENIGASNATCATGAYDSYWRTFGTFLNTYGRQNSFLRLGWESNGDWYQWAGTNPTDYVNCFRHVADAINSTAEPDPTICWCLNAHYSQNPPSHNPMELYPGDAWADGVGLDAYDHYPPSTTKAAFDAQANAPGGLNYWYNFAQAHNKLFGVGEWGVVSGSGSNGGGDSANYVQWMYDWFVAHAGKGFAYEYYFNNCDQNNVGSNLYRPIGNGCFYRNSSAAARYKQLYSAKP
ncbi:glycosyl hydrolase [Frankia tisae]|uniref:glycosyl hydrolase n=1 Tax=Frankia tisae TaxID=2950104 RepID=UPI0021C1220F|nr:glycosyl hydrolase [Frankia tisae]